MSFVKVFKQEEELKPRNSKAFNLVFFKKHLVIKNKNNELKHH